MGLPNPVRALSFPDKCRLHTGGLTVIIEAKLEVRDSASWDTLDKAIDRLGGTSAVHATAAMEGQAAAAAAAAADALSPGESDEEESTGERCIIP